MLLDGEVDAGIATELPQNHPQLAAISCRCWTHPVVAPAGHPLLTEAPLTIEKLARHPLITYDSGLTGRSRIDEAFARHGLSPDIVLAAMDADVIKTYVELGVGVGIVADLAYDAVRELAPARAGSRPSVRREPHPACGASRRASARLHPRLHRCAFAPGMAREAIARASARRCPTTAPGASGLLRLGPARHQPVCPVEEGRAVDHVGDREASSRPCARNASMCSVPKLEGVDDSATEAATIASQRRPSAAAVPSSSRRCTSSELLARNGVAKRACTEAQ